MERGTGPHGAHPYEIGIGEAAFYGPKLDIQIKNVYGKEDTLITIQIDQMLAEQFGMVYTDKDGKQKTPCIIHRTSIGCYERTLALLIEKYAGAFPLWLAPVQVKVMPITDRTNNYAKHVADRLGHDRRYGIDPTKIKNDLGWYPETPFEKGIVLTIDWYLNHQEWMDHVTSGDYQNYYQDMYKNK